MTVVCKRPMPAQVKVPAASGSPARMPSPKASAASKSTELSSSTVVNRNTPAADHEARGPRPSSASRYSAASALPSPQVPQGRRPDVLSRFEEVGAQLTTARDADLPGQVVEALVEAEHDALGLAGQPASLGALLRSRSGGRQHGGAGRVARVGPC